MSITSNNHHPLDEQLVAWLDAREDMPASRAEIVETHVEGCERCRARLEMLTEVETGLQALRVLQPAPPPYFKAQVMAALPANLYKEAATRRNGFRTWFSEQVAAVAFMLAGVVAFILSGDAITAAAQWWTDAQTWLGSSTSYDSTWLGSSPGGALESHLGLLPGLVLLGVGAFLLLVTNLRPAVAVSPPNKQSHALSIHS